MARTVILGRNYTSRLGMIRALGLSGHEVVVVKTNGKKKDIDYYSKYVSKYCFAKEPDRSLLIKCILSLSVDNEKVILVPVDDYTASVIDENISILKDKFLFPNIQMKPGAIVKMMDKNTQKQLAKDAGLPVAEGWEIEIKDGKFEIPDEIKYPCFPKPQISFLGNKECMKKCNNSQELRNIVEKVALISDCPILVEQYIEIEKEYGVLGVCSEGKSIVPGLVEKVLIGEGKHKGVTKLGEVTPLSLNKALQEKIQHFLDLTGFTGLCDIDLYENQGVIYFNELNLRFGAFGYSILCSGANLPSYFVDTIQGKCPQDSEIRIENKTICLSEKVNFEDLMAGYYGLSEFSRIEKMANAFFLKNDLDPSPYRCFLRQIPLVILKSIAKHLINKIRHK